jgi:hypothetical protein
VSRLQQRGLNISTHGLVRLAAEVQAAYPEVTLVYPPPALCTGEYTSEGECTGD